MIKAPPPGSDPVEAGMNEASPGNYVAVNQDQVYENPDWTDPNATDYVEADGF